MKSRVKNLEDTIKTLQFLKSKMEYTNLDFDFYYEGNAVDSVIEEERERYLEEKQLLNSFFIQ